MSSNELDRGGGSAGSSSSSGWADLAGRYVDGHTIKWGSLATLLVGAAQVEVVLGFADVVVASLEGAAGLLVGVGEGLAEFVGMAVAIPIEGATAGWAAASAALASLGPLAPVAAVAVALVAIYLYSEAVTHRVQGWFS